MFVELYSLPRELTASMSLEYYWCYGMKNL